MCSRKCVLRERGGGRCSGGKRVLRGVWCLVSSLLVLVLVLALVCSKYVEVSSGDEEIDGQEVVM